MLKKSASFVLGSSKSSTYPRGYASGFDSPAALLDGLFEHPARLLSCCATRTRREVGEFEVFGTSNPELRTSDRTSLARHAPWTLAARQHPAKQAAVVPPG